jgi:NTP pyrophosphatase (non-canonical NTP hydrolase)/GNAT superfamily N-acetyltransferase
MTITANGSPPIAVGVIESRPAGGESRRAVEVRAAVESDRAAIRELFDECLAPYYDGDHHAHADRVLNAHLAGGLDAFGQFSLRQDMRLLFVHGELAGLVNVVVKRQGTVKSSPLAVRPAFRHLPGLGQMLMRTAETIAREWGARQLYGTVTETNELALEFLERSGWVRAGTAIGQYRSGLAEHLLYKQLTEPAVDEDRLELVPYEPRHFESLKSLILEQYAPHYSGVDESWVQALVEAHGRRQRAVVEEKYKVVYVAEDRSGQVRAVCAAGPKKGGAVKVTPLCADSAAAFDELVSAIPDLFATFGRKLYAHLPPTAEATAAMQRNGWTLEAVMPGAYRDDACTVQWSVTLQDQPEAGRPATAADAVDSGERFDRYTEDLLALVAERDWDREPNLRSLILALGGEVGELQELVQWIPDAQLQARLDQDGELKTALSHEIADILNYLIRAAHVSGIDVTAAAREKLEIVRRRYPVHLAKGNARKYTELQTAAASTESVV